MTIDVFQVLSSFIVLLLSLSVHESAHAWTANKLGDPTARVLGRISLNPFVHAEFFGTFLFPLIGFFSGFIFGWAKPVPVDLNRLRNPKRDYMLVAAAGPGSNLMMATFLFLFMMILKSSSSSMELLVSQVARGMTVGEPLLEAMVSMAYFGLMINLILAVFNLIPVAPLDGAAVLSGFLPDSVSDLYAQIQNYGFFILIGLLFLGVPSYLFRPLIGTVNSFFVY